MFRGLSRRRAVRKVKKSNLNHAVGPKNLGALSRQIDDNMLTNLQDIINKGIEDHAKDANSIFIRVSIPAPGTNTSVLKRLAAFYVEAG